MPNHLCDNNDLLYYLSAGGADYPAATVKTALTGAEREIPTERTARYIEYLTQIGALAANSLSGRASAIDAEGFEISDGALQLGPSLRQSIEELRAMGAPHLTFAREHLDASVSLSVQLVETELLARADPSLAIQNSLYGGFAMALHLGACEAELEGDEGGAAELLALARRAADREIFGAFALHEPHAEGRAPLIECAAERGADGSYLLRGEKCFVIGVGAPFLLVLARDDEAEPREKGERTSFFLVDAKKESAAGRLRITDILQRLGLRGVPSGSIALEGVMARRIGGPRSGPRLFANYQAGMRLVHSFACIGAAEAAFRSGIKYAWETPFRGKALIQHELIAATLDELELDLRSMRALAMTAAWHQGIAMESELNGSQSAGRTPRGALDFQPRAEISREGRGDFDEIDLLRHREPARQLASYLKFYVDFKLVEITRRAAQLRGAEGLCEGAAEAKFLRDAATLPFGEGTSRTESLMAMIKDTVGALLKNPQEHVRQGARARWRSVSPRDPLEKRVARLNLLGQNAQQHLLLRTAGEKMKGLRDRPISEWTAELTRSWDAERDFAFATIHAERLAKLLAEIGLAEIYLAQSLHDPGRRELLEQHLERAEPLARMLYEEISIRGKRIIEEPSHGEG